MLKNFLREAFFEKLISLLEVYGMETMFRPNEERAYELFSILGTSWKKQHGIFSDITLPEKQLLNNLTVVGQQKSEEYVARILFAAAIFMRGGVVSEDPLKMFPYLLTNFPELFDPIKVHKNWTQEKIRLALVEASAQSFSGDLLKITPAAYAHPLLDYPEFQQTRKENTPETRVVKTGRRQKTSTDQKKIYKLDEFAKGWHLNFCHLATHWHGNVLGMYQGVSDFEEFFARIGKPIFGMRRKILALFTIWLQELKIVHHFPCPLPIDFHALRILFATKVFSLQHILPLNQNYPAHAGRIGIRIGDRMITHITKWSQQFMSKHGFRHLHINPALWVLSRELCAFNHQNTSREDGRLLIDPLELAINHTWPKNYHNPCASCPVYGLCVKSIPAAPYYHWGLLIINGQRVDYPHQTLSGLDLVRMPIRTKRNNRS